MLLGLMGGRRVTDFLGETATANVEIRRNVKCSGCPFRLPVPPFFLLSKLVIEVLAPSAVAAYKLPCVRTPWL